jgi:hypothetical protein
MGEGLCTKLVKEVPLSQLDPPLEKVTQPATENIPPKLKMTKNPML